MLVSAMLTYLASAILGRLAGLGVTVACGLLAAFFLMPPTFSLRIEDPADVIELAAYGCLGVSFLVIAPRKVRREQVVAGFDVSPSRREVRQNASLNCVCERLTESAFGRILQTRVSDVAGDVPCTESDLFCMLVNVFEYARLSSDVHALTIYRARRPGWCRLTVAARYALDPPVGVPLMIGRCAQDCTPLDLANWPRNVKASWFDNGVERLYQIEWFPMD
jgi:hypothetical protein